MALVMTTMRTRCSLQPLKGRYRRREAIHFSALTQPRLGWGVRLYHLTASRLGYDIVEYPILLFQVEELLLSVGEFFRGVGKLFLRTHFLCVLFLGGRASIAQSQLEVINDSLMLLSYLRYLRGVLRVLNSQIFLCSKICDT